MDGWVGSICLDRFQTDSNPEDNQRVKTEYGSA